MKNKDFDCVELQDRGAARIYAQTQKMTVAQQLAFWQKKTQALQKRQRAVRQKYLKRRQTRQP